MLRMRWTIPFSVAVAAIALPHPSHGQDSLSSSSYNIPLSPIDLPREGIFGIDYVWLWVAAVLLLAIAVVALAVNVSLRVRAERTLRKREKKYRTVFDLLHDVYVETNADDFTIRDISSSVRELFGIERSKLIGASTAELVPDEAARRELRAALDNQGRVLDYELSLRNRAGREMTLSLSARVLPAEDDEPRRVVGTFRDITDRQRYAAALADRERQYRLLAEHIRDVVTRHDTDGIILYASPSSASVLGYRPEEMVGMNPYDLFHEDDRDHISENHQALMTGQGTGPVTYRMRRKQGDYIWIETINKVVRDEATGNVTELVAVSRDVTARKQIEVSLRRAKAEAEEANSYKSEFLANVSHEIRTPLNAVIGYAGLLAEQSSDTKSRRYLDSIRNAAENLLELMNDILDLSAAEAGKIQLNPEPVDLRGLLQDVFSLFRSKAHSKGLRLHLRVAKGIPDRLVLDSARLRQVMLNLVGNGVKFTEEGSVSVEARWSGIGTDGTAALEIAVRDTGIGIPADKHQVIFEAFRQQDGGTARKYGGTGLGLAISLRLAQAMEGDIQIESELNRGSVFRLRLPQVTVSGQEQDFRNRERQDQEKKRPTESSARQRQRGTAKRDLEHLPSTLERYLLEHALPRWDEISSVMVLDEIEEFADELSAAARQYGNEALAEYAAGLAEACETLDIVAVKESINRLPDLAETLAAGAKNRDE
jgi:PAS domain S-box-containing protein